MSLKTSQPEIQLTAPGIPVIANGGVYNLNITGNLLLAGISAANVVTAFVPGHAFKILSVSAIAMVAATTSGKAATITPYIGSTAVTGGVLALTTSSLGTKGAVQTGTTVTANNEGSATDSITLTASSVTAFVEGSACIVLRIQNLDG